MHWCSAACTSGSQGSWRQGSGYSRRSKRSSSIKAALGVQSKTHRNRWKWRTLIGACALPAASVSGILDLQELCGRIDAVGCNRLCFLATVGYCRQYTQLS